MSDIHDFLKQVFGQVHAERHKKRIITKLDGDLLLRFQMWRSKQEAFIEDLQRTQAKLDNERAKLWIDIEDKFSLHGKKLSFDEETHEIYERVEVREKQ